MKRPKRLSLAVKIWLVISSFILISVVFSYLLSNLFYEKIYVNSMEAALLSEGQNLAKDYKGGPLTEAFKEKVEWYNSKSRSEVFVVNNPRELSACLPFDIDYQTLIGEEEREQLLQGKPIKKMGYEERFGRRILAVIVPLLDGDRLEGIIYLYVPLAMISEFTKEFTVLWSIAGLLFFVITVYLGTFLIRRLTKPLKMMTEAAKKVSEGDYSVRIKDFSGDEIGHLASAFNHMAESLQQEDERKKEFLANVSHELRTPLSYINGYSEALLTGVVKNGEDYDKYLSIIVRESKRMNRLVEDLLDLSRLDSPEYQLEKIPLPFAQLLEDATQKYVMTAKEKGLELIYDLDPEIIIEGDEGRIEQVLQNLLDNAFRYTHEGGIHISLKKHPEGCVLSVKDTGIGIPKEDLKHIRERFYRVNKARTRSDGGTGLGLAITEKIIKHHGGRMIIESEVNKGTTVSVIFPVLQID